MHFEISSLRDIYMYLRRTSPKLKEDQLITMAIDIQRNMIMMNTLEVNETDFKVKASPDLLDNAISKQIA